MYSTITFQTIRGISCDLNADRHMRYQFFSIFGLLCFGGFDGELLFTNDPLLLRASLFG